MTSTQFGRRALDRAGQAMLLLAVSAIAPDAHADAMTAEDLRVMCSGTDAQTQNACRFYILGVTQGIDLGVGMAAGKTVGGSPCVPEGISSFALTAAVKMKLGEVLMMYPADRKLDASGFIGAVLVRAFPCRR